MRQMYRYAEIKKQVYLIPCAPEVEVKAIHN